jgi:hypothetical protein
VTVKTSAPTAPLAAIRGHLGFTSRKKKVLGFLLGCLPFWG